MSLAAPVSDSTGDSAELIRRLSAICRGRDLSALGARLDGLASLVRSDLAAIERDLAQPTGVRDVHRGADHLLALGGKRLRPMCVVLAARVGSGLDVRTRSLAVAVELVHSATLLHDDVVDLGDARRGAPSTRAVWGNAISIFAGDWLLVEALRRVRAAGVPGTLERLLDAIDEMIVAESLQLERRGRLETGRDVWNRVARGKTAALFRWAMLAGGRAGGLAEPEIAALEEYGEHVGVAFQAIDDLLDLAGDRTATGKALFADVREGKMTYPLILARERDAAVEPLLREILDGQSGDDTARFARLAVLLERTGALDDCRALAEAHATRAVAALSSLPPGRAVDALATVTDAVVARRT